MRCIGVFYSKPFENFIAPHTTEYRYKDLFELKCYGYGATRKIGKATLSDASLNEQYYKETSASLFLENDLLINAEEWL